MTEVIAETSGTNTIVPAASYDSLLWYVNDAVSKVKPLQEAFDAIVKIPYEKGTASKEFMKMVVDGEVMPLGIEKAIADGRLKKVEVIEPKELKEAKIHLEAVTVDLSRRVMADLADAKSILNPKATTKSGGERKKSALITQADFDGIPQADKVTYKMTYSNGEIVLTDLKGKAHICRTMATLGRHKNGE
jgi:hypothetical protein